MGELLAYILGWILQFLGETLLNIALEVGVWLLGQVLKEPLRWPEPVNAAIAIWGYMIYGGIAGGLSLLVFPHHMVQRTALRAAGLIIIPLVSGLVMVGLGALRRRKSRETIRLESFFYAFFFALATALVRLMWAK